MPYDVKRSPGTCPVGRPWAVVRQGSNRQFGCHPTKDAAEAQQAALYANEKKSAGPSEVPMEKTDQPAELRANSSATAERRVALTNTIAYRRARLPKRGDTERRALPMEELELREAPDAVIADEGGNELRLLEFIGYASVFDRAYKVGSFEETVQSGAFKRSLANPDLDCVLRTEHSDLPLARTTGRVTLANGTEVPTLMLEEDAKGLRVRALLDPTDPDVQRLVPKYRRGDLREMSFAFRCSDDVWSEDYTQRTVRAAEIHRGDVSVVTYGASAGTTSSLRSEDAVGELRSVGPEGLVSSLQDFAFQWVATYLSVYGERKTIEALEARAGKVLSATSLDALTRVLNLISAADDAVDEAQPLLADLMGVPNPDADEDDEDGDEDEEDEMSMNAEAGAPERRDDPTGEDWQIKDGLQTVKMLVAKLKAAQLSDPDNEEDPNDADVSAALDAIDAACDTAIVAQGKDSKYERAAEAPSTAADLPAARYDEFEFDLRAIGGRS